MLINGWDIRNAGAKQWSVTPAMSGMSNSSDWMTGHMMPVVLKSDITWKTLKIVIMVKGRSREEILSRISSITARLAQPAELVLDGFHNTFYGYCKQTAINEKNLRGSHKWTDLTVTMQCCEYSELMELRPSRNRIQISNPGNLPSPVSISFKLNQTVLDRTEALTIRGFNGKDIVFSKIRTGHSFIADSINGRYTYIPENILDTAFRINRSIVGSDEVIGGSMANRITEVNLWEAPAVKPGISELIFYDEDGHEIEELYDYVKDLEIRVKPMYM